MGENEERNERSEGTVRKSAKPSRIAYVPIAEEDLAPYEPPVKKKHKALKITGLTLLRLVQLTQEYLIIIQINFSKVLLLTELTVQGKPHMKQSRRSRRQWRIIP